MQVKEDLLLNFQRSGPKKSERYPMQMRQTSGDCCHPESNVCQENMLSCPLSFLQKVEFSFGGDHMKEINGNDFGTKAQGIVGSLQEKGSPHCVGMGQRNNEEGEGSKVAKVWGAPREVVYILPMPWET